MTIGWFRDLIIIIYGLLGAVFLVFMIFIIMSLYNRVKVILDSAKVTAANIQEISTVAKEQMVRPIMQVGSVFQGIAKWIETIGAYVKKFKSKKEVNNG